MSKIYKRLKDYKTTSAAARAGFGVNSRAAKKLKREQRKKLRMVSKYLVLQND